MNQSIIHIGLPRTATTWLQSQVFPLVQNYTFIPKKDVLEKLIHAIYSGNAKMEWDYAGKGVKPLLISEEMISAHTRAGAVNLVYLKEYLNRIKSSFDNPVIVLFLRSQYTLLGSMYNLYVQKGGTYSLKKFLNPETTLQNIYLCSNAFFNFENILDRILTCFSKENIRVYLYEDLKENPLRFIQKFSDDLDIKLGGRVDFTSFENKSLNMGKTNMQRLLNYFTKYGIPFKRYFFHVPGTYGLMKNNNYKYPSEPDMNKTIVTYCEQFTESNRRIMNSFFLTSMEKFNYPL